MSQALFEQLPEGGFDQWLRALRSVDAAKFRARG